MNILLKGAAVAAVLAAAAPAWAQTAEELNSAELYSIAVARAAHTPWAFPFYPYPYAYPYLYPTAYPGPSGLAPFAPAEIVKGIGGHWRWENGAYQWHPDKA